LVLFVLFFGFCFFFLILTELKTLHALSTSFCPFFPPVFYLLSLLLFLLCSGGLGGDCLTETLGTVHAQAVVERRTSRNVMLKVAVKNRHWCEDVGKRITIITVGLEERKLQRLFKAAQGIESSNKKVRRAGGFGLSQESLEWRWGVYLDRASISQPFCQ